MFYSSHAGTKLTVHRQSLVHSYNPSSHTQTHNSPATQHCSGVGLYVLQSKQKSTVILSNFFLLEKKSRPQREAKPGKLANVNLLNRMTDTQVKIIERLFLFEILHTRKGIKWKMANFLLRRFYFQ